MKIIDLDCGPMNDWLNLFKLHYSHNGTEGKWMFASRHRDPKLVKGERLTPDGVVIIPVTTDGNLVCIKEFRFPIGRTEYAFPAGLLEGNSVEFTVRRELVEETGMNLKEILGASPPLTTSSGMTDETFQYVLAHVDGSIENQEKTRVEDIQPFLCTQDIAKNLCDRTDVYSDVAISGKAWSILVNFANNGVNGVIANFV